MTKNPISWNFDAKRILLRERYDESHPIKNILNGKRYREDSRSDYSVYSPGHVENYRYVNNIFEVLYPNGGTDHKDIMNSFWTTYKHYLQIAYPKVFMPDGKLSKGAETWSTPSEGKNPDTGYPPFTYGKNQTVGPEYTKYYKKHFPTLTVSPSHTWFEFLLNNYDEFSDVHDDDKLNTFAVLTHTIGNMCVVPKGFNAGRNASDYWDFAMLYMKEFTDNFGGWDALVKAYALGDYVREADNTVIPLWDGHFDNKPSIIYHPLTHNDIQQFLTLVNTNIQNRGQRMIQSHNNRLLQSHNNLTV